MKTIIAQERKLIACDHCGYLNNFIAIDAGSNCRCRRCQHPLYFQRRDWLNRANALLITGILLFICANVFAFIGLEVNGNSQSSNLLTGALALHQNGQSLLGLLLLGIIFLFPLAQLAVLSYVLLCRNTHNKAPGLSGCLVFLWQSRPWNMLEIFFISVLVTSVKLGDSADIIIGPGLISFALLVVTLIALDLQINRHELWRWYRRENFFCFNEDSQFHSCEKCDALVGHLLWKKNKQCPRCLHEVRPRIPHSLQKTTALIIASIILYIPAMVLPIMSVTSFGQTTEQTVLSGIIHLFHDGMWFIGLIVFIASILVPVAKLVVMIYLIWSTQQNHNHEKSRTQMYKLTEFIGRWSMIDVFVIALLVALVQFGVLMTIQPQPAALAFAAVVILTMLAAHAFDPRLIWDNTATESTSWDTHNDG